MAGGLTVRRGDLVIAAAPGDYGKPRPNLVIQSDLFIGMNSVTICPLTSLLRDDQPYLRLTVQPSPSNGLQIPSQILIDKITTLPISKITQRIGRLEREEMLQVNESLALFLGVG